MAAALFKHTARACTQKHTAKDSHQHDHVALLHLHKVLLVNISLVLPAAAAALLAGNAGPGPVLLAAGGNLGRHCRGSTGVCCIHVQWQVAIAGGRMALQDRCMQQWQTDRQQQRVRRLHMQCMLGCGACECVWWVVLAQACVGALHKHVWPPGGATKSAGRHVCVCAAVPELKPPVCSSL